MSIEYGCRSRISVITAQRSESIAQVKGSHSESFEVDRQTSYTRSLCRQQTNANDRVINAQEKDYLNNEVQNFSNHDLFHG
jgi:hypothetical protein